MRKSHLIALAAIAVLALGVVGASSYRAFAQSARGSLAQSQDCANQDGDRAEIKGADGDSVELQCGDQNDADGERQEAAPAGTPDITAKDAQDTAEGYLKAGTATQVELDDEDGTLIYSVEIGGSDVKVDAMTGVVLSVETGQD